MPLGNSHYETRASSYTAQADKTYGHSKKQKQFNQYDAWVVEQFKWCIQQHRAMLCSILF